MRETKQPVAIVHLIGAQGVMFTGVEYIDGTVSGSNGREFTTGTLKQLVEAGRQFSAELRRFVHMEDYLQFMHNNVVGDEVRQRERLLKSQKN